ncbi:MAG: transcription termination factor Rho [Clostridia bacterium]|nr:transcription termination factor Rho [Clostridia bacterium]
MELLMLKTMMELQEMAKELGIKDYSKYKKTELAQLVFEKMPKPDKHEEIDQENEEISVADDKFEKVEGVLEVMADGYGFIRGENYLPTNKDVYVSANQIKRFNLKTGDKITGNTRETRAHEKLKPLIFVSTINGDVPAMAIKRRPFEYLVPVYPDTRLKLETKKEEYATRIIDVIAPLGKGQRGLIVAPPKAGKTTLLKNIANAISENYPDIEIIVLLIDERPEEVSDMQRSIKGDVIYSTFDELPAHHIKVAEMVLERAQRIAEQKKDVVVLLDSLTRLTRAYNLVIPSTGRTLSGGIDPGAFHMPKKFFGAARNIENGGSVTILATALTETGSRMDDVIYEEFKGTGNMEIHLDIKLQERRIFPAIDIIKSGTRKEELLLTEKEATTMLKLRRALATDQSYEITEKFINLMISTENNEQLISKIK